MVVFLYVEVERTYFYDKAKYKKIGIKDWSKHNGSGYNKNTILVFYTLMPRHEKKT
jgi:hypothetical protein